MKRLFLLSFVIMTSTVLLAVNYGYRAPKYPTRHNFMLACDYNLLNETSPLRFFKQVVNNRHNLKDRDILHKLLCDFTHLRRTMKDGAIVYVSSNDFERYADELLVRGKKKVIFLVKGDPVFPDEYSCCDRIEEILAHENLLQVYVENNNYRGVSEKVNSLPIGICHANRYKFPHFPKTLDRDLNKIVANLKPTTERKLIPLCDFHFANSSASRVNEMGEDRAKIATYFKEREVCDFLPKRMPQLELWTMKGERAFDISPIGNGFDCYRTWESLVLGCIVIVKTSFLDPLFEGLPVVIVNDWDEVTKDNMERWLVQYGDVFHDDTVREKLTHEFWMKKIRLCQKEYREKALAKNA